MSQVDHEAQIKTLFLNGRCTRLRCAIYHDYINSDDVRSCTAKPVLNDTLLGDMMSFYDIICASESLLIK